MSWNRPSDELGIFKGVKTFTNLPIIVWLEKNPLYIRKFIGTKKKPFSGLTKPYQGHNKPPHDHRINTFKCPWAALLNKLIPLFRRPFSCLIIICFPPVQHRKNACDSIQWRLQRHQQSVTVSVTLWFITRVKVLETPSKCEWTVSRPWR